MLSVNQIWAAHIAYFRCLVPVLYIVLKVVSQISSIGHIVFFYVICDLLHICAWVFYVCLGVNARMCVPRILEKNGAELDQVFSAAPVTLG